MPVAAPILGKSVAAPWAGLIPGLALCAAIAGTAFALRQVPGLDLLSPMILSIVIGMALHNLWGTPGLARPGVVFSMRRVLRTAIVLLGLQLTLALMARIHGSAEGARVPTPWFVFGFIAMMLVASVVPLTGEVRSQVVTTMSFLLSMALAAMGLETDLRKLPARGLRPLTLGALATVFIAVLSLTLVRTLL